MNMAVATGMRQHPPVPVAVCIPTRGQVTLPWALALRDLILPPGSIILTTIGEPVDAARNELVSRALQAGAERIFFIDDDVRLESNAYEVLNKHMTEDGISVVNGLYWFRSGRPSVLKRNTLGMLQSATIREHDLIFGDVMGLGCTLIDSRVFQRLQPPWFQWTFDPEVGHRDDAVDFYGKLQAAGIDFVCDTSVRGKHGMYMERDEQGELQRGR